MRPTGTDNHLFGRAGAEFRRGWAPYCILLTALVVSCLAAWYEKTSSDARAQMQFRAACNEARETVSYTLDTYITLLRAGAGLFAASNYVSPDEFRAFVERLQLRRRYAGVQGVGYAPRIGRNHLYGRDSLHVAPGTSMRVRPAGPREEYFPVGYLEPRDDRNRAAIGYDMFSEPVRKAAMEHARDSGVPAATGKVTLMQEIEGRHQAGMLIYYPDYGKGPIPQTVAQRRERLRGFVYSPFRADDLLKGVFRGRTPRYLRYRVYDGGVALPQNLLHDSASVHGDTGSVDSREPVHTQYASLDISGRAWVIVFTSTPEFENSVGGSRAADVLFAGVALSLVLFGVTRAQVRARAEAEAKSRQLSAKEEALVQANTRTNAVLESITDGFVSFDNAWRINYANEQVGRMLGRDPHDLLGQTIWDAYPPALGQDVQRHLVQAMDDEKPVRYETWDSETRRWFEVRAYPASGGISVYFADVTPRRMREEQLQEQFAQEHAISTTLQNALLSPPLLDIPGIEIEPIYRPAFREALVGGDFYDVFRPDDRLIGVVIGDVAGKGIQAAVRTAMAKNALRAFAYEDPSPAVVLSRLNKVASRESQEGFITLLYGVLDVREREFVFCNAGHEPPLWLIPDGPRVIELDRPSVALGCDDNAVYEQYRIELGPGHKLLLYTDGVTEARSGEDFYGAERLKEFFLAKHAETAAQITSLLFREISAFSSDQLRDDVAALALCLD